VESRNRGLVIHRVVTSERVEDWRIGELLDAQEDKLPRVVPRQLSCVAAADHVTVGQLAQRLEANGP